MLILICGNSYRRSKWHFREGGCAAQNVTMVFSPIFLPLLI